MVEILGSSPEPKNMKYKDYYKVGDKVKLQKNCENKGKKGDVYTVTKIDKYLWTNMINCRGWSDWNASFNPLNNDYFIKVCKECEKENCPGVVN